MTSDKFRVDEALRVVHKLFPEAEVVKCDGSQEKTSVILGLAIDVKKRQAVSRQSKKTDQQLSFDFWDSSASQQRGGI
jgi:hypothetical protein